MYQPQGKDFPARPLCLTQICSHLSSILGQLSDCRLLHNQNRHMIVVWRSSSPVGQGIHVIYDAFLVHESTSNMPPTLMSSVIFLKISCLNLWRKVWVSTNLMKSGESIKSSSILLEMFSPHPHQHLHFS